MSNKKIEFVYRGVTYTVSYTVLAAVNGTDEARIILGTPCFQDGRKIPDWQRTQALLASAMTAIKREPLSGQE